MDHVNNPLQDRNVRNNINQENFWQYKSMILCFANKRYPIPAKILNDLVERREPNITLYDDNKNPSLILFFDYIPLIFHIKSLMNPQTHIAIQIMGLHKKKGDIIQIVQSRLINEVNNYFESNFYDLSEFYILEGEIDTGPDLERISRQKVRQTSKRYSKKISNSSRVKGFIGKDESYYREKSEEYDLSSAFETDSETSWLHDGFCEEKKAESENEDEDEIY